MAEKRKFRTDASLKAELITREAVIPFLQRRGFDDVSESRTARGDAITQVVTARDCETGERVKMHVRLCWRRDGRNANERQYAAAQLRARLINGSWGETLDFITERDRLDGNSHTLILQYDDGDFVHAALIPCDEITPIWEAQRLISDEIIRAGKAGRTRKNHAANGDSPTIWLQDTRHPETHAISDVLWSWPGVVNLLSRADTAVGTASVDDTFDDCPADYSQLGRDEATKTERVVSGYPRDPKVRAAVVARAAGGCERGGCGERRDFPGFLDVHHILGVGTSDRVWNCVALCPNCHREAHFSPDRDTINASLQEYARRFADGSS